MLIEVVRRARRRFLWNELLAQAAFALSAAFGAVVLLLLLGTQVLSWYWLLVLPLAALSLGLYRTWKRLPEPYAIAQLIDSRLALADTLSTAWYFSHGDDLKPDPVRDAQRHAAEQLAPAVRVSEAIPFTMPRAVYLMALLGVVASSLFALRYALDRRLDLKQPLARIVRQALGGNTVEAAKADRKKIAAGEKKLPKDVMTMKVDAPDQTPANLDPAPDSALEPSAEPDVDNSKKTPTKASSKDGKGEKDGAEQGEEEGEATENAQASNGESGDGQQGSSPSKQNADRSAENQTSGAAGDKSSLVSKLKDAMQNLLSRMKQQPGASGTPQQSAMAQNGRQQMKGSQNGEGQKGRSGQGKQQGQAQDGEGEDAQSGEQAQSAQNAQGRGTGHSDDQQSSKQPGSGIGRQDGSKDVKLAEQLAAMGKISEIIGKRSANVTGEMTVEVQSNSQQLRTPYSQRSAQHGEAGAEISRDEVPVMFQPYVQEYFEQVRKQADPGARRPDTKNAAPPRGDRKPG